jgi:3-oxoacyl-[acyl-carrier-protein] synthase II
MWRPASIRRCARSSVRISFWQHGTFGLCRPDLQAFKLERNVLRQPQGTLRVTAPRVGVFGWGLIAPKSPNIEAFRKNLACSESWLAPFDGFGPSNFLAGTPEFQFSDYRGWIDARFAPRHFQNLKEKMDTPALYAIGAFIQALGQNEALEELLRELGSQAHVYIGTGLGAIDTSYRASVALYEAQRRWNAFWADPAQNSARKMAERDVEGRPPDPETVPAAERDEALNAWNAFWMVRSPELEVYLAEAAEIDGLGVEGDIETAKLNVLRERSKRLARLQEKWHAPDPPWKVSANLIWNIHNTPAAQVSILGRITGLSFAPVAACSTFGVALGLAMKAIRTGEAKAVVVGATDPPPHPLTVGSFYTARVLSANRQVSHPLTHLQGTHVAGGSVVWIVGDLEFMRARGLKPIGMEPVAVGVSSDAHHIITPSADGPKEAIEQALKEAEATAGDLDSWDLHATATPGDFSEIMTFHALFPESVLVTARKGTFGHGMSAGGGWELTAQYLGYEQGQLFPTSVRKDELNPAIAELHRNFVFAQACPAGSGLAGKLSMGIGGINACVLSRPLEPEQDTTIKSPPKL